MILVLADTHAHHDQALWHKVYGSLGSEFSIILAIVTPFVIGQFLDCLRDLGEHLADKVSEIKWANLKNLDEKRRPVFEDYYFVYYVFNVNLSIGLSIGYALTFAFQIFPNDYCYIFTPAIFISILVFIINACTLRIEIKKFLNN